MKKFREAVCEAEDGMLLSILLWPIAFVLLGLSFASGQWYRLWLFELLGAGYLWYAAFTLGLFLSLWGLKLRRRKLMIVLALALGLYASSTLSWYVPRLRDAKPGGVPLAVMTYNVNYKLWDADAVTELVRSHSVDVFGLVEPFKEQAAELRENVEDLYPHYYRATGGGLSLFSRYPIADAATENLGTRYHSLFATVDIQGIPVRVVVAHPLAPVSRYNFVNRNEAMAALAEYAAQQQLTTIIVGDFNLTAWSPYFRSFIKNSGLRSVNLGHGLNPTWFYNGSGRALQSIEKLKQWLKLPIDHVFVTQNVSVDQVTTPSSGVSDHRPVIARLRLR